MVKICHIKRPILNVPNHGLLAVSSKRSYWMNGEKLQIYLLKDARSKEKDIGDVYTHWLNNTSLSFEFTGDKKISDIRIDYNPKEGSWSYVGTDATLVDYNTVTLNIGWSGKDVIYHEVGHSLGLLHEHQNPLVDINWNKDAVIKELSGPPNNWSVSIIYNNVLSAINPDSVNYTSFDPESVMLYFFPDRWTLDGKGTKENPVPSNQDLLHIRTLYPQPTIVMDCTDIVSQIPNLDRLLKKQLVYLASAFENRDYSKVSKKELASFIKSL